MNPPARITLIAARLDSGGVADHVNSLALTLRARGATVAAFAREDYSVKPLRDGHEPGTGHWIGLHFVAYGWAKHGILRRSDIEQIREACAGHRIVIYLHELWIGAELGSSVKHRLIGALQRRGLLRLLSVLQPARVLTSNPVYQAMLAREGIAATQLSLPGNLPVPSGSDRRAAREWLATAGLAEARAPALAAVFGLIHPEWDARVAIADWHAHAERNKRTPAVLALGRHGAAGSRKLAALREHIPNLRVICAGEQPAPLLAGLLAECSLGLATSPWSLIGKSGTAAAFLEAGLPVIVTRDDWHWRPGPTPAPVPHPRLWKWTASSPFAWDQFLATRDRPAPGLAQVTDTWLQLISEQ